MNAEFYKSHFVLYFKIKTDLIINWMNPIYKINWSDSIKTHLSKTNEASLISGLLPILHFQEVFAGTYKFQGLLPQ